MGEAQALQAEQYRLIEGAPPRDMSPYTSWRETAQPENLELLEFYGTYLAGQYMGFGTALSLDAVRAALDIEGVPRERWPGVTKRLLRIHLMVVAHLPKKEK